MATAQRPILILDDIGEGGDALGAGTFYHGPTNERAGREIASEHADHWIFRGIHPHKASGWTKSGKPMSAAPGSIAAPGAPVDGPSRDPADVPDDAPGGLGGKEADDFGNGALAAAGSDTSERVELPEARPKAK